MASINLTNGKAIEPALTTLDVAGDNPKGWYALSSKELGNFGAQMADLGCDEATVSALNAGVDGLLGFVDEVADSLEGFDHDSILRYGVDENGGLAGISMPLIKATADGDLVCCIGDNDVPVQQNPEGQFAIGQISGRLETEAANTYTTYRLRLSSKATGDRYQVKVAVRDGVVEDDILDAVEAGTSIAEHLKVVGQGGAAKNMADLELGAYDVVGVKEMKGAEGRPSWFILQLAGGLEVKSRSKTDAVLRTGLNVDFVRSRGNHVLLQITGKRPYGDNIQVDCGLSVVPADRAAKKLAATAAANAEAALAAAPAKRPAPAPKPAPTPEPVAAEAKPEPAPVAAAAKAENPAAKAAAARRSKVAAAAASEDSSAVDVNF